MAGRITIDAQLCKGCGLCVWVCPQGAIRLSSESNSVGFFPAESVGENCSGCAMCALICPEAAIEVYRDSAGKKESTATNK